MTAWGVLGCATGGGGSKKRRLINPRFVGDIQGEKQHTVLGRTYSEVRASECTHLASRRFLCLSMPLFHSPCVYPQVPSSGNFGESYHEAWIVLGST